MHVGGVMSNMVVCGVLKPKSEVWEQVNDSLRGPQGLKRIAPSFIPGTAALAANVLPIFIRRMSVRFGIASINGKAARGGASNTETLAFRGIINKISAVASRYFCGRA